MMRGLVVMGVPQAALDNRECEKSDVKALFLYLLSLPGSFKFTERRRDAFFQWVALQDEAQGKQLQTCKLDRQHANEYA